MNYFGDSTSLFVSKFAKFAAVACITGRFSSYEESHRYWSRENLLGFPTHGFVTEYGRLKLNGSECTAAS